MNHEKLSVLAEEFATFGFAWGGAHFALDYCKWEMTWTTIICFIGSMWWVSLGGRALATIICRLEYSSLREKDLKLCTFPLAAVIAVFFRCQLPSCVDRICRAMSLYRSMSIAQQDIAFTSGWSTAVRIILFGILCTDGGRIMRNFMAAVQIVDVILLQTSTVATFVYFVALQDGVYLGIMVGWFSFYLLAFLDSMLLE